MVTASGDGVTLPTEPENRLAAETTAAAATAGRADRRRALCRTATAAATAAGLLVDERQRHVHFGVLREVARVGQVERASRAIDAVVARPKAGRRIHDIAQKEIGGVDEDAAG